jgi:NAD(P)-dependent dehydrogenase (short-subunit alcohol dehydrogenase family)
LDEAALDQGVASAKALMGGIDVAANLAGANRSSLIADETAEGLTG